RAPALAVAIRPRARLRGEDGVEECGGVRRPLRAQIPAEYQRSARLPYYSWTVRRSSGFGVLSLEASRRSGWSYRPKGSSLWNRQALFGARTNRGRRARLSNAAMYGIKVMTLRPVVPGRTPPSVGRDASRPVLRFRDAAGVNTATRSRGPTRASSRSATHTVTALTTALAAMAESSPAGMRAAIDA